MAIKSSTEMEVDDMQRMRESILESVAAGKGFFRSQQVGERDLTVVEKREIADALLAQNVPLFLQRYWKYVKLEDVGYFRSHNEYEVEFYVSEIRRSRDPRASRAGVKNRRFGALRRLIQGGTYFSDEEMRVRSPFLFEQFIGRYLTDEERMEAYRAQHADDKFSHFLMGQLERNVTNCLFEQQKCQDEAVEEEEEEDESELEEDESEDKMPITPYEKSRLRSEFTNMMYESFMSGEDKDFDYSSVDYNEEYDPTEKDMDAEEKYFNEEEGKLP